ncbi:MAG: gliding motility-associated ABC transporter substrate-binding protein GldG [Cyclobacteriaceae bacterium]|nr:gliding motility-associated ABC transporter substrate-binding protein GldG [Cyclobacteriaceae bacterium]
MMNTKKTEELLKLAITVVVIVLINIIASRYFFRVDLTEEKRFSIKKVTKDMLQNLDADVYIEVYLAGDLNADFRRLQEGIKEVLQEFEVYSNNKVKFSFIDPTTALDQKAQNEFISSLSAKGITPTQVYDKEKGKRTQKLILPGALVSYGEGERGVMLLKGNGAASAREKINQSIEGVEFELATTIALLSGLEQKKIGLLKGHNELDSLNAFGLNSSLSNEYLVEDIIIDSAISVLEYDAIVIAKPTKSFSEKDKYYLDQYIMHGGKVLFFIDRLEVNMDSIATENNFAFPYNLNLDDMLFKYGVRINGDLVQDMLSARYPIVTGNFGDQPQIQMIPWPFFPLISKYGDHFAVKNLDAITTKFVSTMDTIKALGIKKTPLLFTSQYSRHITAPVKVSLNDLRNNLTRDKFSEQNLVTGYLLEGQFSSLYKNRFLPKGVSDEDKFNESLDTKIIVISDGDIARNDINPKTGEPLALGFDPYAGMKFANEDFILNMISYLVDGEGLISARSKEVKIRPLDSIKAEEDRTYWQVVNIILPLIVLFALGVAKYFLRRKKYTNF